MLVHACAQYTISKGRAIPETVELTSEGIYIAIMCWFFQMDCYANCVVYIFLTDVLYTGAIWAKFRKTESKSHAVKWAGRPQLYKAYLLSFEMQCNNYTELTPSFKEYLDLVFPLCIPNTP